jgi:ATP-dependent DNA helicase DinG
MSVDDDDVVSLLHTVVEGIGGSPRDGQDRMAGEVSAAIRSGTHLLVQAGTGTGKSIGYLVPAIAHVDAGGGPVVVATATLALQHQLVSRDLPAIDAAMRSAGLDPPTWAVLKGRSNYLCKQRLTGGEEAPDEVLFEMPSAGRFTEQAGIIRDWAEHTDTGDRDELGDIDGRVWRAFSVTAKECVGATRCPFGAECFAERARAKAADADIIITNHALLALHTIEGLPVLPDHDVVVVDEAHELADRATSAMTVELSAAAITRALASARKALSSEAVAGCDDAANALAEALFSVDGRVVDVPAPLRAALAAVRDSSHVALTELNAQSTGDPDEVARTQRSKSAFDQLHDAAGTILSANRDSVVWVERGGGNRPPTLKVAPLSMAAALRSGLFVESTTVLTSATLSLNGRFDHVASELGLAANGSNWQGLDVGSPFEFSRQGILYVASHLPKPGRDGPSAESQQLLADLVTASDGRALVLYSSWRGVDAAAETLEGVAEACGFALHVQRRSDTVGPLVAAFAEDQRSVLVGTLSLWQGVDVSGDACQLVVIDRIPFPRPDDPLTQARSQRADDAGGNGFTQVSVPRAALMLAQGAGRLIRSHSDRGVVAVLDPRLMTAGYGAALRRSMPGLWLTTDTSVVLGALTRLSHTSSNQDHDSPEPKTTATSR